MALKIETNYHINHGWAIETMTLKIETNYHVNHGWVIETMALKVETNYHMNHRWVSGSGYTSLSQTYLSPRKYNHFK